MKCNLVLIYFPSYMRKSVHVYLQIAGAGVTDAQHV